jgi:hypothetical protein
MSALLAESDANYVDTTPPNTGGRITSAISTASNASGIVRGFLPHGSIVIPFGDQNDIADWYDVTKLGSLRLQITAGSSVGSSSTCEVITQQMRRY